MRRVHITLVAVLALLAAACGSGSSTTQETEATTPSSLVETTSTEATSAGSTASGAPGEYNENAPLLSQQFSPVEPGEYQLTNFGTELSFVLSGSWWVQPNEVAFIALTHPDSIGPDDRDVVIMRPRGLSDPTAPAAPQDDQDSWDLEDIRGWIENLAPGIAVTNLATVSLGGRSADVFDVTLTEDVECGRDFCVGFVEANANTGKALSPGSNYRIYWVEDEYEPIAIVVGYVGDDVDWLETADAFLSTVAFGESGPHPNPPGSDPCWVGLNCQSEAGELRVPVAGGLSMTLPDSRFILQNNGLAVVTLDAPGGVAMFRPVFDGDGNAVDTVDDVVGLLTEAAASATQSSVAGGLPWAGVVLDVEGPSPNNVLAWDASPGRGYQVPDLARIWVFDTPAGPLVISAESFGAAATRDVAIELAEQILPTLAFIEG